MGRVMDAAQQMGCHQMTSSALLHRYLDAMLQWREQDGPNTDLIIVCETEDDEGLCGRWVVHVSQVCQWEVAITQHCLTLNDEILEMS